MSVNVSVIEDAAPVRELLAEWINSDEWFHCLSLHESTRSALAQLPKKKPSIVLVDINLPDLSGVECVRRLKPLMPETQFVMLTVYEDADRIFSALAAGATGYLLKQTTCEQLIASLKQICGGGSPMSASIARKVVQSFQRPPAQKGELDSVKVEALTAREREVLELLVRGFFYKEISETLGISKSTVNTHVRNIYEKLHVRTRGQALAKLNKTEIR